MAWSKCFLECGLYGNAPHRLGLITSQTFLATIKQTWDPVEMSYNSKLVVGVVANLKS